MTDHARALPTRADGERERPVDGGRQDLYSVRQRPGVSAASVERPATISASRPAALTTAARTGPDRPDYFTDARGDVFRSGNDGADVHQGGSWSKLAGSTANDRAEDPLFKPNAEPDMGQRSVGNDPIHRPNTSPDMGQRPGHDAGRNTGTTGTTERAIPNAQRADPKPFVDRPGYRPGQDVQRIEQQRQRATQRSLEFNGYQRSDARPRVSNPPSRGGAGGKSGAPAGRGGSGSGGSRSKRR